MKITNYYIATALTCISFCLGACKEDRDLAGEDGSLQLSVGMSDKINIASRTLSSEEQMQLEDECKIRIYSEKALVRKYEGTDNVPASIPLMSGSYSVRVTAGDSVAASFEQRFFEGKKNFVIAKGESSEVEVACAIANTVVAFTWDESLQEVFKGDCQVTVTSATGELVYSSTNADAKGYFNLPADNRKLTCKFTATKLNDGGTYELVKELTDVKAATLYNLTWKYASVEQGATGGALVALDVNEEPLSEKSTTITIKQRPVVLLKDAENKEYNLAQPMYVETNTSAAYYLVVSTSSPLKSAVLQNNKFTEFGLPVNSMDLMNLGGQDATIEAAGISLIAPQSAMQTGGTWKILFSADLVAKMTAQEGQVVTKLTAIDDNNKQREVTWTLVASNATVVTTEAIPYEIWTSKATLHGKVTGTLAATPKFQYRVKGSGALWTTVDADLVESTFSKEITGLTPGTTYEYQAMDGTQASSVTCEFTTEVAFQPENASFEYTQVLKVSALLGSRDCLFFYQEGKEMWWDTGNTGSATAGRNLTTQDSSIKNTGNYSAKLASASIMGTFAAGNLFTGKFLGTEDMTKGILGWGRPCTSRPKALKVWVRYTPGTVDVGGSQISAGDTDKGIIYVAVGDWKSSDSQYGAEWPVVVRTKGPVLFNPHDEGTIGYGEHIFTENYGTETETSLKEITIPLDYEGYGGYDKKPKSIIIVASASQYGDYYEGSSSSVMWLDDMELIYE